MKRFFRVQLRTLDVEAANGFYRGVLGREPPNTVRLHEQAIARGARPHWLGFAETGDVERALARFIERGATSLGPKWVNPEGLEAAVIRDPGGAILALAKPPPAPPGATAEDGTFPDVIFHSLNTVGVARAIADYTDLFGWDFGERVDLGAMGSFYPFSWEVSAPRMGVFADIDGRPGVHPHWTFHFRVLDLDVALERVRSAGGIALAPIDLPNGDRIAVCDDPQGAAFALHETADK